MNPKCRIANAERGVVLPIVLVVLMVVTTLVLTQVRRGTLDERLASNWSRSISGQTTAETVLRQCEAVVLQVERTWWDLKLPSSLANNNGEPAWKSALDPAKIKTIPPADLPPGATSGICIIENATDELRPGDHYLGTAEASRGVAAGVDPSMRKTRFTSVVTFPDSTAFGSVTYRSQSEVRWMINSIN
jgi:hypothetical protein